MSEILTAERDGSLLIFECDFDVTLDIAERMRTELEQAEKAVILTRGVRLVAILSTAKSQ